MGNLISLQNDTTIILLQTRSFLPSAHSYGRKVIGFLRNDIKIDEIVLQLVSKETAAPTPAANKYLAMPACADFNTTCFSYCCSVEVCFRRSDIFMPLESMRAIAKSMKQVIFGKKADLPISASLALQNNINSSFMLYYTSDEEFKAAITF